MLLGNDVVMQERTYEPDLERKRSFQFNSGRFVIWKSQHFSVHRVIQDVNAKLSLLDTLHPKRRRTTIVKAWDVESEQEEHSLSLSQNSSPSLSDQEQTATQKVADSVAGPQGFHLFKCLKETASNCQSQNIPGKQKELGNAVQRSPKDLQLLGEFQTQPRQEQFLHAHTGRNGIQFPTVEHKPLEAGPIQNMVIVPHIIV